MPEAQVHVVTINMLSDLANRLTDLDGPHCDAVLVLPPDGTLILGSAHELIDACLSFDGDVCVAASPLPLSQTNVAAKMADAVARATGWSPIERGSGWRPARAYPYPYALLGPVEALLELAGHLHRLANQAHQYDADLMATLLLEGGCALILDTGTQVFHVLDGTGTDTVAVGGRAYSGGEQPLVIVDPRLGSPALARLRDDLADPGARDLAHLLRYQGAIDLDNGELVVATPDLLVIPFWTTDFCAAIVRAAESAGVWVTSPDAPGLRSEVAVQALSPRLMVMLEEDLETRVWPRIVRHWRTAASAGLEAALVVRREAGEAAVRLESGENLGQVRGVVRLNDGYHGGGLLFPRQQWDSRAAPVGSLVIWPSDATHPYRPESVRQGVEYELSLHWHRPRGTPQPVTVTLPNF